MLEKAIFDACGLKLHNFYGSSECGGIAYDASATPRTDAACAGSPMKNVQLSIGEDGCLEVRGRAVGTTYWPDRNSKMNKGVFYSSDLAEIRDGFVFLRGRAGDVINVAGRKLSPEEIEKELLSHPQVRECLVFGAPAEEAGRGEIIVACIAPNGELTRDALRQFLLERLPAWQVPREWIFIPSLEANRRGKISRTEW